MKGMRIAAAIVCSSLSLALGTFASAQQRSTAPTWPDSYLARLEAFALIQMLNGELLASRSVTVTLEKWCADHRLAAEPKIRAKLLRDREKPASPETRERLQVSVDEPVKHRYVQLTCGDHVLSEADNWYVPSRLTPEMNQVLETTDTPFGRAVQALGFYRQTIAAEVLWSPLPKGWELGVGDRPVEVKGTLAIPENLLQHRAVLYSREQKPFSEVNEVYADDVLAFPPVAVKQ
jgi:chorismate-pyruvate lyase